MPATSQDLVWAALGSSDQIQVKMGVSGDPADLPVHITSSAAECLQRFEEPDIGTVKLILLDKKWTNNQRMQSLPSCRRESSSGNWPVKLSR